MTIAKDEGLTVEERDIPIEELKDFDEVLACGTAVVVTPVGSLTSVGKGDVNKFEFSQEVGPITQQLYDQVRAIQSGEIEDKHGWNFKIE